MIICQFNSFTKNDGKPLFSASSAKFNILFRNQGGRGHSLIERSLNCFDFCASEKRNTCFR